MTNGEVGMCRIGIKMGVDQNFRVCLPTSDHAHQQAKNGAVAWGALDAVMAHGVLCLRRLGDMRIRFVTHLVPTESTMTGFNVRCRWPPRP